MAAAQAVEYDAQGKPLPASPQGIEYDAEGKPIGAAPSAPAQPSMISKIGSGALDFGKGVLKGAGSTANAIGNIAAPDWLVHAVSPQTKLPSDQQQEGYFKPANTTQAVGKGIEQAGEFMLPGGAEEMGAEKLASLAPKIGKYVEPAAKIGMSALSSGTVNKLQGGDFGTGAAAGAGGAVVGQGLKAAAPALAETALKVRGNQRLFGRTVGEAALNDTSGIRPASIASSAQKTISRLSPEMDAADQASAAAGNRGSLLPARQGVADTIAGHNANRAVGTAADIQPISDFLHTDQLTHLPLAPDQSAPGLRALKRGLNADYIGKWSPDQPAAQKGAARAAYGNINEELHRISPETEALDQRISSLIPVAQQGERVASQAPTIQRTVGRFGAHSGALLGLTAGAMEGRREGGIPGAIAGGLTGVLAPELIASPEGQMLIARSLNKAGALKPLVGAALQADRNKGEK